MFSNFKELVEPAKVSDKPFTVNFLRGGFIFLLLQFPLLLLLL